VAGQCFVDPDGAQLGVEILEGRDRAHVRGFTNAAPASSRGERCAGLGVDELARHEDVGAYIGARLLGAVWTSDPADGW
jgi:hypothetical protein